MISDFSLGLYHTDSRFTLSMTDGDALPMADSVLYTMTIQSSSLYCLHWLQRHRLITNNLHVPTT